MNGDWSFLTVPTTCPFQWQSTPDLTISLLIPVGMYVYSITCSLTLTKSLAAILNLPIRSIFYPSCNPLVALFVNSLVIPSLSCVHKHLLSSDWERRPCQSKYLDTVSVCLCVPVLLWSLQFLVRCFFSVWKQHLNLLLNPVSLLAITFTKSRPASSHPHFPSPH